MIRLGRICFICNSPHRAEYDQMKLDGKPIKEIHAYSHNQYQENHLEYYHFQKHFANHVEVLVREQEKAGKLRDQYVKEVIKKSIDIGRRLQRNLELVTDKIEEKAQHMDNPIAEEMFLKFVGESRLIIEQFLKWTSKLDLEESSEDTMKKIMYCLQDFSPDLIEKFIERWKSYGQHS